MRLPSDRVERHAVYRDLIRRCSVSRDERKADHRRLRSLYLTGSDTQDAARYNRLFEHVQDTSADCFAPDGVRLGVKMPPHYGQRWTDEAEAARDELHRLLDDSGALLVFDMGVEWGFVYPTTVFKTILNRNQPTLTILADPADLGVLQEEMDDLDDQEALTHHYEMNRAAFRRLVMHGIPDPRRQADILAQGMEYAAPSKLAGTEAMGPTMSRIILSAASPTMIGTATMAGADPAQARTQEDVVEMAELWVWDDELIPLCDHCHLAEHELLHREDIPELFAHAFKRSDAYEGDYRVVTVLKSSMNEPVLWEPANSLDPGHHCFYGLTLNPTAGYIWGLSEVGRLEGLQTWRERSETELDTAIDRNLDPALIGVGVSGTADEKLVKLKKRGSTVSFPQSGSTDIKPMGFTIPPEAEQRPARIDAMFDRASGRRARTEAVGARSGDQEMAKAMLGGGPTLKKAMRAEGVLGAVATGLLRQQRRVMKSTLTKADATQFLLSQMPGDFSARVVGHSGSPLFQQQLLAKIAFAASKNALDKDELIELLQLPMTEILTAKARRRQQAEGQAGEEKMKSEKTKAEAAMVRALKP